MIWAISLLAIGVVLLAFSILLRRKLGRAWMLSVLAGGVLLIACGGWFTYGQIDRQIQQRESVYLGLQYLEQFQIDASSFYLKKGNEENFAAVSADYLLEKTRGNDLTARLNLDRATALAKTEEEQELLGILRGVDVQNSEHLVDARVFEFTQDSSHFSFYVFCHTACFKIRHYIPFLFGRRSRPVFLMHNAL